MCTRWIRWGACCGLVACCGLLACADGAKPTPVAPVEPVGASTAGGVGGDAPPPASDPRACPASPPTVGAACSVEFSPKAASPLCAYGDHERPSCRARFHCNKGEWTNPFGDPDPKCSEPMAACPAAAQHLGSCDKPTLDACRKGKEECACRMCKSKSGVVQQWRCYGAPAAPCPAMAPRLGTACDHPESVVCAYGAKGTGDFWQTMCVGGKWDGHAGDVDICTTD